jgi:cysteine-rich repeat protein
MLSPMLDPGSIPSLGKSPALEDVTAPLQERARSWLDSNCSYCHRPGGANAGFDARFTTPFGDQGLVWTAVRDDLGNPGTVVIYPGDPILSAAWQRAAAVGSIAMPPLAKALAELPAVDVLAAWIERMSLELQPTGLAYEYYEVSGLTALPDFDALAPVETGTVSTVDISVRNRDDDFAFRFSAYLRIASGGDYTFYTSSDDGSQLFIDGALVVDNDGLHGVVEESGVVTLPSGYHEIVVTMFERGGDEVLTASWAGPDTSGVKELLGSGRLYRELPSGDVNRPPVLGSPGDHSDRQGDMVSLDLSASDEDGDLLYFDASGLPEGLAIDHESGRVSGTLTAPGVHAVTASVSDGPDVSVVRFEWAVTAPYCGDDIMDEGEQCDDGNTDDGDGCSGLCEIETPMPDGGEPDGGGPDGGVPDGGVPDGGEPDGGVPDGGTPGGGSGGGCGVRPASAPFDLPVWLSVLVLVLTRRRRPGSQSTRS